MDIYSIIKRVKPYLIPIILGGVGLGFVIYGFFSFTTSKKDSSEIVFESTGSATVISTPEKKITIDIEGGVLKPGVYSLDPNSRIQDAIMAAGGMSATASHDIVAKSLNLAAKLTDGAKIYIPVQGDTSTSSGLAENVGANSTQSIFGATTININSASATDLDKLPGIGEVTAQKIISNRPYGVVDELLSKKIVSKKVFDQIKEKVSIY